MIDQFREFQFERRQSHIVKKMNTFTKVDIQERRVILYGEHVEIYDDRPDSVVINKIEGRGDDPLFVFATPDEKRRFVVAVRYSLNYSDPEGNNEQQNQGSDSGRASASSENSGEI